MKTDFWNSAAINGLLLALVSIIVMLLQTVLPGYGWVLTLLKLAATIGALLYFMKQYSREQEYFTYGNGFSYGFATSFCSAIAMAVYVFVHHTYLFPETMQLQTEAAMQIAQNYGNTGGVDLEKFVGKTPVYMPFYSLFYALIWGLIIPSILANFTKKEQPPFYDSEGDE